MTETPPQTRATAARALLVSAIASGQGKTTVTAALARHLMRTGRRVRVFKTGADFLDALMLERACGRPVHVLDLWMVGEDECRRLLDEAVRAADVVLIEGVMGLYDGTPSSADLARAFDLPVLAVIDVRAMAQTVGAVAVGLRDFGAIRLAGVIANGVASEGHKAMVSLALRDIPLVATLPWQAAPLPERHLGLKLPGDTADIDAALEALGAAVSFFSPLAGEAVPATASAVFLPGGYPELHAETLARAVRFHASIRRAHAAGIPILAECGGMMALTESLGDMHGRQWPMAGILAGSTHMQPRLVRLGLQRWKTNLGDIRGHTFHYSTFDSPLTVAGWTTTHPRGDSGEAIYRLGTLTASYFHAYFGSCPQAIAALFQGAAP